jgi:dynein light chain roadblock-type
MAEIDEVMTRTRAREKVKGIVIANRDGISVRSTFSRHEEAAKLASIVYVLTEKARSIVRDLDPTNNMTFLRFRLRRHEIMVAPGKDFYLIVQQGIEED